MRFTSVQTAPNDALFGATTQASAAAFAPAAKRLITVTGSTNITSITSTPFKAGDVITLLFAGSLDVVHGNNLKLAGQGNVSVQADCALTLAYNGTDWYQVSYSNNAAP